jgi:2-oxoglutarate ferredoxin oxidoreductase subunit gamma
MSPPVVPAPARPVQIRLTGAGGQGVITAGVILAEAALQDGKNVVQTQSYGPEARLGASKAEVIISAAPIAYPEVTAPDFLICLSKDSARKYLRHIHESTVVLLDDSADETSPHGVVHRLPLVATAEKCGSKAATNVVALWTLNALAHLVEPDHLRAAILKRVPPRFRAGNERAIDAAQLLIQTLNSQPLQGGVHARNGTLAAAAVNGAPEIRA